MSKQNLLFLVAVIVAFSASSCGSVMLHRGQKIQPGMDQNDVFTRLGDPVMKDVRGNAEIYTWFRKKTVCVISFVDRKVESRACFKEGQTPFVARAGGPTERVPATAKNDD